MCGSARCTREAPISPVAENEALVLNPVSFDLETTNDEIAVDVPLPEEPAEMNGEQIRGARQVRQRKEVTSEPVDTCRET